MPAGQTDIESAGELGKMEDNSSTYRHRILVADDEKSIADAVATMMGMSGMEAIVVNDGAQPTQRSQEGRPTRRFSTS